jgi:hypothetical protein
MQDFPANSRRAEQAANEPKKIAPVTSATVEQRKKGLGRKFKETFVVGDARTTRDYVIFEVMIPAVRDMMFDAVEGAFKRMIYGESARHRPGATSGGYPGLGHVNYGGYSSIKPTGGPGSRPAQTSQPQRQLSRMSKARNSFDEIIIPDRHGAEEVIERMFDILSQYGSVSVADLYELTGLASSHTDIKWGWTQLRGAKAIRLRQGGFVLDLPEPQALA